MIYLASPYSHDNPTIMAERYRDTAELLAHLLFVKNLSVFSPIVYGHGLAADLGLPTDATAWKRFNTTMLRSSHAIWVVQLDGWRESRGVTQEIKLADLLNIPTFYVDAYGNTVL